MSEPGSLNHRIIESPEKRKRKRISLSKLSSLSREHPNQILLTILDRQSDIVCLLRKSNVKPKVLAYVSIIFGKACTADMPANVNHFISYINCELEHILPHMQEYLVSLQKEQNFEKYNLDSILFLSTFLEKYQSIMSSSSDFISALLPILNSMSKKSFENHENLYQLFSEKLKNINTLHQCHLKPLTLSEMNSNFQIEDGLQKFPESFRSIAVLPNDKDINLPCLFLRPNIVKGKYKNTEHYLDVQFRLLREDYIKPLRDGVAEYLTIKKKGQSFQNSKNARIYTNVRIVGEHFVHGVLLHVLKFSDEEFANTNWEESQRFLTQSLLSFSSDDFQTILFASVIRRNVDDLKKGLLYVHFEEITEELDSNNSINFVVIETSAYFEAYRHNLIALQQLNEESLPLSKYIIDVQKIVECPRYMQSTTTYDMRPLLLPLAGKRKIVDGTEDPENIARNVKVLDENCWPTNFELNLDYSQYLAVKAAITKEFAIIQGPPGTGKTYIGLRIVQLLLHNLDEWFSNKINSLPILVVSYTNHALDQFLEGLLLFTKQIARIGGRCSNDKLSQFQLRELKRSAIGNREFPAYIPNIIRQKNAELNRVKEQINKIKEIIEISTITVLNESVLSKNIHFIHRLTLKEGHARQSSQLNKFALYDWLGIGLYDGRPVITKCNKNKPLGDLIGVAEPEMKLQCNDATDIEYFENHDDLDFHGFDKFSFNKNIEGECHESKDSVWKSQKNINQCLEMIKYVRYCLEHYEAMTEDIAVVVDHVWHLDYGNRWELYKYWLQNFIKDKSKESFNLQREVRTIMEELGEIRAEEDLFVLQKAYVVGMTTSGAAKYRHLVQRMNPVVLVVEEAAEILESHIVTSLAPDTQHVILIGDQQQLRPSPTVHMLAVKYGMNISLFERMVMNGVDYCKLSIQHRMRPEIAALIVPHIYPNLKNHKRVAEFEDIKGVGKNVFFVSHSFQESLECDSTSKVNEYEAEFLIQLCRYLLLQGYKSSQITVLTTYSGQLLVFKNLVTDDVKDVCFSVVDNFQGEENDIILISFVRSNVEGIIGFLKVPNRVCVALSRARKGLFCIGNFSLLARKSILWGKIVDTLKQNRSIGPSLRLICQKHPNTFNEIAHPADFRHVPDGGCSKKCETRLSCGHACFRLCHPYGHEKVVCYRPCNKTCERGHHCEKLCFEDCFCKILVDKTLSQCGHNVNVLCGKPESHIICSYKCTRILRCTHPCPNICGEKCAVRCDKPCLKTCDKGHPCLKHCFEFCGPCEVLVDKTLKRCGHIVRTSCGKSEYAIVCTSKCEEVLSCTHKCPNKCGERCETRCKKPCLKKCENGHPCQKRCFESCGSCKMFVDKTFVTCGHSVKVTCEKFVEENEVCSFTCDKKLNCGHACSNVCGRPCVKICMQLKETISPVCGHPVKVDCYIASSSENLLKICENEMFKTCSEPCQEILSCGHECSGTCGSCYQKRLHVPCNKICKRILLCGHKCECICSKSCPSCQKPCQNKCAHSKCLKKCFEPCSKCTKSCEWSCLHTKCSRPCSEVCNREPCNEPCSKILSCNHPCIGFCGEPCPKVCRICNANAENSNFFKIEDCVNYVLLEDCGHAFKVHELNRWFNDISEGKRIIRLKTCPTCKTVVRKNIRYNYLIKDTILQLETIKQITNMNKEMNSELQNALLQKSISLNSSSYFQTANNFNKCLSSPLIKSIEEVTNIENIMSIASGLSSSIVERSSEIFLHKQVSKLTEYASVTGKWVANFMLKYFLTVSEPQLLQLTYEVHRLRLIGRLVQFVEPKLFESQCLDLFENCTRSLMHYAPFNDDCLKAFESAYQIFTSRFVGNSLDVSDIEFPCLKAVDMSAGHWYQCSKGHVYCTIQYVGENRKDCYECERDKKDIYAFACESYYLRYRWTPLSTSTVTDSPNCRPKRVEKQKKSNQR